MDEKAFTDFLATGEYVPTMDAAFEDGKAAHGLTDYGKANYPGGRMPKSLADHDKVHHPNGFKEGDSCKYREALAKQDNSDDIRGDGERQPKQVPEIKKEDFAKAVKWIEETDIIDDVRSMSAKDVNWLWNNARQEVMGLYGLKDDPVKAVESRWRDKKFVDAFSGMPMYDDGGDEATTEDAAPRKMYPWKTSPSLAAHDKRFHPNGFDPSKGRCEYREQLRKALEKGDNADMGLAALAAAEKTEAKAKNKKNIDKYLSMSDDGFAKDVLSLSDKDIKKLESEIKGFLANSIPNADVKVVKDEPEKGQFAIAVADIPDDKLLAALSSYPRTGYWSFTDRYEGNNVKLDGDDKPRKYAFLSFKAKETETDKPSEPSKQEKIAKLQKLHDDYNKWFETADRGDVQSWLDENEKRVKALKDALEGLEVGKDIQWDSNKRNFYPLAEEAGGKKPPTFNPPNKFHMLTPDENGKSLWARRNDGDPVAKRLTELIEDFNKEAQWGFGDDDLMAYAQAFRDMDAGKTPTAFPEFAGPEMSQKKVDLSAIFSSHPELIREYIIERLEDANFHKEAKALSEGRYDEVLEA